MTPSPIRRVLLIFPPTTERKGSLRWCVPPLGLAYLAAALRPRREVIVVDAVVEGYDRVVPDGPERVRYGLSVEAIAARAVAEMPDFIGISCLYSSQMKVVKRLVHALKQALPEVPIALGGGHPTFRASETLETIPQLDAIVLGEGDRLLPGLLDHLETRGSLADMRGVAFREGGRAVERPGTGPLADVDTLPFPAWDLLPVERYHRIGMAFNMTSRRQRFLPVLSSRGCPGRCVFCSSARFWQHRFRGRAPDSVLEEMERGITDHAIEEFQFSDDNLTYDAERARLLFQGMLDRRLPVAWSCPNGLAPWNLDDTLLELMVRAGLYELILSVESGNQEVLSRIMHKPTRLDRVPQIVTTARSLGIRVHALFVIGLPGETPEQIRDTFRFARSLELHGATFFIANPLPGSELEETCRSDGLLPSDFSFDDLDYYCLALPHQHMNGRPLSRWASRESLRINLGLALRDPLTFAHKWGALAWNHPVALTQSLASRVLDLFR